jgi:hypothetical protein
MTRDEEHHPVVAVAEEAGLQLSREEFALLVSEFRRAYRTTDRLGAAGILGSFLVCAALLPLAARTHFPGPASWALFAAAWTVALTTFVLHRRRVRRLMRAYELRCPECHAPLVDEPLGVRRVEQILATGRCTTCGEMFLAR